MGWGPQTAGGGFERWATTNRSPWALSADTPPSFFRPGVRRVCWRPPCPDSTAPSLSFTRTSSCRGRRLRRRPPPRSTSTRPLPPPRPPPRPRVGLTSWRSTPRRRTRPTPTRRFPRTTRHRRPSTPTRRPSGRGSSHAVHFPQLRGVEAAGGTASRPCFLPVLQMQSKEMPVEKFLCFCTLAELLRYFGRSRNWTFLSLILAELLLLLRSL